MQKLHIQRKGEALEFSYDIVWESSFEQLSQAVSALQLQGKKACIVTDSNVKDLYLEEVKTRLETVFDLVEVFVIPAGEEHKQLSVIQEMYTLLINRRFDRKDILFALGGGVTGDMCGFAAATYLRGVDFIQIPTTLLAQVDSSIGGKTGVDFDQFKNMVGAFHQPRLVYMNMSVIRTLPDTQFASGMGEVIKSALIRDADFFRWLEDHTAEIQERNVEALTHMIRECCGIKAAVVEEDPKEQGVRAILNFGHTIGHAVEKLMDFRMLHGLCVGYGLLAASRISRERGMLTEEDYQRILSLCRSFELPETTDLTEVDRILSTMKSDKKMEQGNLKFILLQKIGQAYIERNISEEEILSAIQEAANE